MFKVENVICSSCGTVGKPKNRMKGSTFIELILWFFFLIPGMIYSRWRASTKAKVCASCANATVIPLDSPAGQKLRREYAK